ncbi:unnamed protein product [Gongylonema pulchrum]|uniref:N-acetyltransferase domain-containing protein n=1 Tax=Gongylonema pulchrum TaxID=637853 RepID=A0A183ECN0_9BILA|nr:unnamed protein product [Gongylonema pulchrum]
MPWIHIALAIPIDAPGLVVGGIVTVELLHSEMSYVAALCVRKDFRKKQLLYSGREKKRPTERHQKCSNRQRASALVHSARMPWIHIALAIPIDAPGLVVGGIVTVELLHSEMSYVAALCVRKDFRGRRIGSALFSLFEQIINEFHRIGFCDIASTTPFVLLMLHKNFSAFKNAIANQTAWKLVLATTGVRNEMEKILLRPPHFPFRAKYSVKKLVGYAGNIVETYRQILSTSKKVFFLLKYLVRRLKIYMFERIRSVCSLCFIHTIRNAVRERKSTSPVTSLT